MESHRNLNQVHGLLIPKSYSPRIKEKFSTFKKRQKLCQRWETKSNHKEPLEKTLNEGYLQDKWPVIFRNVSKGLRKCCRMKEIKEMQLSARLSQDYDLHHFDVEGSETEEVRLLQHRGHCQVVTLFKLWQTEACQCLWDKHSILKNWWAYSYSIQEKVYLQLSYEFVIFNFSNK